VRESKGLVSGTRVVAYHRFDLSAVDLEQQVSDFVDAHLARCASMNVMPAPIGVDDAESGDESSPARLATHWRPTIEGNRP
jgi:hypothetical protein